MMPVWPSTAPSKLKSSVLLTLTPSRASYGRCARPSVPFGTLRGLVIRLDCDEPSPSAIQRRKYFLSAYMMPRLILVLAVAARAAALSQWLKLPDIDLNPGTFTRRDAASAAAAVSAGAAASPAAASGASKTASSRRAGDIQQWPRIPVWPSWAGGRVIPMGLPNADPFLLVAHHKHWFDPRDPLRGPFRAFGKATGLPYIDVEVESCVEINH